MVVGGMLEEEKKKIPHGSGQRVYVCGQPLRTCPMVATCRAEAWWEDSANIEQAGTGSLFKGE